MAEREPSRVEHEPLCSLPRERAIELEISVLIVAENRMPGMRKVDANLMGTAGHEAHFEQAEARRFSDGADSGQRRLSAFLHADATLTFCSDMLVQRLTDLELLPDR